MMARIRTLKPQYFLSRSLARCPRDARTTFQGLWCEADDVGRGIANARLLKGSIWPLDDDITPQAVEAHLQALAAEHIVLYEVDGERYYEILHWEKHQSAAFRRGEAQHPAPPLDCPVQLELIDAHDLARSDMHESAGRGQDGSGVGRGDDEDSPLNPIRQLRAVPAEPSRSSSFDATIEIAATAIADQRTDVDDQEKYARGAAKNLREEKAKFIDERIAAGKDPVAIAAELAGSTVSAHLAAIKVGYMQAKEA